MISKTNHRTTGLTKSLGKKLPKLKTLEELLKCLQSIEDLIIDCPDGVSSSHVQMREKIQLDVRKEYKKVKKSLRDILVSPEAMGLLLVVLPALIETARETEQEEADSSDDERTPSEVDDECIRRKSS